MCLAEKAEMVQRFQYSSLKMVQLELHQIVPCKIRKFELYHLSFDKPEIVTSYPIWQLNILD